jgi:hypothetical protein
MGVKGQQLLQQCMAAIVRMAGMRFAGYSKGLQTSHH